MPEEISDVTDFLLKSSLQFVQKRAILYIAGGF